MQRVFASFAVILSCATLAGSAITAPSPVISPAAIDPAVAAQTQKMWERFAGAMPELKLQMPKLSDLSPFKLIDKERLRNFQCNSAMEADKKAHAALRRADPKRRGFPLGTWPTACSVGTRYRTIEI